MQEDLVATAQTGSCDTKGLAQLALPVRCRYRQRQRRRHLLRLQHLARLGPVE